MSYDLYFWREEIEIDSPPDKTVETLSNDQHIEGISSFEREAIIDEFKKVFPDIVDENIQLDWEGAGSYFQVSFSYGPEKKVNLIIVNCGYNLLDSSETMNSIIDVCTKFGCALYDPQTNERYQQP